MRWRMVVVVALVSVPLAACGSNGGNGAESPTGGASPTVTATVSPPASPTATATVSPTATSGTVTPAACESFGSTTQQKSDDPLALSTLTGASMRLGRHDCFERFVFEMAGSGEQPGWSVGYQDPLTHPGSGEPVSLRGDADLEIVVGVWTVNDYEGRPDEWPPFTGPDDVVTSDFVAVKEARNLYAYEGITTIGLGLDEERPFQVGWLQSPPRLVVDIYTGEPAS